MGLSEEGEDGAVVFEAVRGDAYPIVGVVDGHEVLGKTETKDIEVWTHGFFSYRLFYST